MLGNATKFVWNTVDPRPVYRKAIGAATKAAKYEAFDMSGLTGSWFSSSDSSSSDVSSSWLPSLGKSSSDGSGSWFSSLGSSSSDGSGSSLSSLGTTMPSFSSNLPTFGNPTYTPIPDFSGQSMFNIVFTCTNISTTPPPTTLTPAQLQQRQTNIGLCKANSAYFCKYIQDTSSSFAPGDYAALTQMYCGPSSGTAGLVTVASGLGTATIGIYIAFFIGALLTALLVANQMIYMPVIMRIFAFLAVLSISMINPFFMGIILLYYLFVICLDAFRKDAATKQFIRPQTVLPIWPRRPNQSLFTRIFTAPFTYVEPDVADRGYQNYMKYLDRYVDNLQRSAKLTDEDLKEAGMTGMKKSIIEELAKSVEAMVALGTQTLTFTTANMANASNAANADAAASAAAVQEAEAALVAATQAKVNAIAAQTEQDKQIANKGELEGQEAEAAFAAKSAAAKDVAKATKAEEAAKQKLVNAKAGANAAAKAAAQVRQTATAVKAAVNAAEAAQGTAANATAKEPIAQTGAASTIVASARPAVNPVHSHIPTGGHHGNYQGM